ncbi:MAG: carbohydrate ABC transporter permease [Microbacteriaceae bacterium]
MRSYRLQRRAGDWATRAVLTVVGVAVLFPFVYAFFASLKPLPEMLASGARLLPQEWTLDNYFRAWEQAGFSQYFQNSLIVVVGVTTLDIVIASLLGYLLGRNLMPFGRAIQAVMAATLFVGLGTATLFPRYVIASALGIDNLVGVVLVEVSGLTVIHVFLARAFVSTLPVELEDAARVDGNGLIGTYRHIVLPLMRPILFTVGILAFEASWNSFQIPYVFTLASPELRTLVVGVFALRSTEDGAQAYDLMLAGAMLIIIPVTVVFLLFQKRFIAGMTEGSVKG